ncbi:MAG: DMT family transporter [Anaerolineales bacterium]|nr:MAG: DMT family transporter [Anaerolineales bacterium]
MSAIVQSILAGLGGMFGWGLYDFLGGLFSKRIGNFKTLFWSQLAGLVFTVLLPFVFGASLNVPPWIAILIIVAAIFYAAAYLLFFRGFELGNVSIVSATMNLYAVFTMVFAYILLGQRLSTLQFVGVMMIISGVALVSLKWSEIREQRLKLFAGIKETMLAALLFGIFWPISEIISENIGWEAATLFVKVGVVVCLWLFSVLVRRELGVANTAPRTRVMIFGAGILEAAAVACVNWGLTVGDVILVTPISSALSVVTITMAVIFLKEKITTLQGAGMVMVITGIVLTAF